VLLHTGHPNPGIKAVLKRYRSRWARAPLPVVVHLLAEDPARLARAVHQLEETEGVAGIELGLRAGIEIGAARELVQAASGELPVLARVGLEAAQELGLPLTAAGASAVVLGPPRGSLPDTEGNLVSGRLYGPALFALALEAVRSLAGQGVSVQAGCGAYRAEDIAAFYSAGAAAVQLDTVLWRGEGDLERL
jgi:dihydroorotate dehydrogenase